MKQKLIRITTIPQSLGGLLKGQMKFMSQYFEVIGISSNGDGVLEEFAKTEGFKDISINMTRKITPLKDLIVVCRLVLIFKKEKPFIVHSHTPKAGTLGMLAAKLAGVPHRLHTIAGLPLVEATGLKRRLLNLVEKITYGCATQIYPNSNGLKDIILEHKFTKPSKLKILANGSSNGIDTSHYDSKLISENEIITLKNKLSIKPNDFVFVFVGRLVKDKGINELIDAFDILDKEHTNIKLLLVGPYENDLDPLKLSTLKKIKENANIIEAGGQYDVRPYFAISHVLVFPSYREGFPNVVLQAGAMGLASIVSNINGCNEIITHNFNGLIIPVKDVNAIMLVMKTLLNNPELTNELRKNSRDIIIEKYQQNVIWQALLEEYNTLKNKEKDA